MTKLIWTVQYVLAVSGVPSLLPHNPHAVLAKHLVLGNHIEAFSLRLGDDQSVERIAVMKRELLYSRGDWPINGEDLQPSLHLLGDVVGRPRRKHQSPQARLDCHLPDTRSAQPPFAVTGLNRATRCPAQPCVASHEPEKRVSVQEESHSLYSSIPGTGASKSSLIIILPASDPNLRLLSR